MTQVDQELPDGWAEALPDDPAFAKFLAEQLPELAADASGHARTDSAQAERESARAGGASAGQASIRGDVTAPTAGVNRLLASVAELPARYAPFFGRIATLWDVSEEVVTAVLDRARLQSAWKRTPLPGVRVLEASGGPRTSGGDVFLVRFAPGTRFPRHRHPGRELMLVLEGSYTDTLGTRVAAGDLHDMGPGSEHGFLVSENEPCIGAVLHFGREFTNPVLRVIDKLLGR
ncbi:MAG TPA: cupin domain-containing protein [Polyangiaceae bacterium]|nr:cupin domain-containing protein [Polyangiaceae bacterium]